MARAVMLPALIWATVDSTPLLIVIWAAAGIVAVASGFSTGAYLIVLGTFVLALVKAHESPKPALVAS